MSRVSAIAALILVAAGATGCKNLLKKRQPVEAASVSATAPAVPIAVAPPAPAPAPTEPPDSDLATPEDFEEAALDKISAKNFEAELQRLKKEIEQ